MPLVSVVMANYNGERFLQSALDSILAQTYRDFEFIIVDDGSTDGSKEIIAHYHQNDRRIRAAYLAHSGLVNALNYGCGLSEGCFIARHDSDDIAKPDRLEIQVAYMLANPAVALVGGGIECIDTTGKVLFIMNWPSRADSLHDYLLLDCYICQSTVLFRKDVFYEIGAYRSEYADAEDYDLYLRMADNNLVENLPNILCQYRLHPAQVSSSKSSQQLISGIAARLATRARRSGKAEPSWNHDGVSRQDLIAAGVNSERIDSLIKEYSGYTSYTDGWRWKNTKFCKLV